MMNILKLKISEKSNLHIKLIDKAVRFISKCFTREYKSRIMFLLALIFRRRNTVVFMWMISFSY